MVKVIGASPDFARVIQSSIGRYPSWYVNAARVAQVVVSTREDVKAQMAMFEHGSRNLFVWSGIGSLLQKAMGHELAHAVDDNFGKPHFFTSVPEWQKIHRNQSHFDIPKYRDQPLEYFADVVTKFFLLGPERMKTTNPAEVIFLTTWVFPVLQKEFGNG